MDTVTVLYRGHILELDPAIVKALIRQAQKADLGPAEREAIQDIARLIQEAETKPRVLVGILDGNTWSTWPTLISLHPEELEDFDPKRT